jgi:hypothetical protein
MLEMRWVSYGSSIEGLAKVSSSPETLTLIALSLHIFLMRT